MLKLLMIDDSKDDRFFLRWTLSKEVPDATLHEVSYAEDALALLCSADEQEFDVVLVDINMPRMNGFEFADAYFEACPQPDAAVPVFITSGNLHPDDQIKVETHPAVRGYLQKPVSAETLLEQMGQQADV